MYWQRTYRQKGPKEPWYILTNLPTLKLALAVYRCRWGIDHYAGRIQAHQDKTPRQSDFPHKQLYFQRGFYALSLMQQAL